MQRPPQDGRGRLPGFVRALRWALFALLVVATVLSLAGVPELQRAVAAGRWPSATLAIPPAVLALFVVGYAVYRFMLVRAGRYAPGKALVRIGLMVLVLGVVAGIVLERGPGPAPAPVDLGRALTSPDADVRAMAAELLRHRTADVALRQAEPLARLLDDPSPEVRRQAHATLVALAGSDVGGEGPGAADRWRAHFAGGVATP